MLLSEGFYHSSIERNISQTGSVLPLADDKFVINPFETSYRELLQASDGEVLIEGGLFDAELIFGASEILKVNGALSRMF